MAGNPALEPGTRYMGDVHPTGITELYIPRSPTVDICFVHGFTGHPERTWRSKQRAIKMDLSTKKGPKLRRFPFSHQRDYESESSGDTSAIPEFTYWPRDLLPVVVPNARVLTFGYDTNIRHSLNGPISQNRLGDHARDFLTALASYRTQETHRPLIFVAHSLGGLLVKDLLRLSKFYEQSQPEFYSTYESTSSLFFFGTPHAGADPRNILHRVLTDLIKAVGFQVNKEIVETLMPGAERSTLLAEDFLKWTSERNWGIYTFQEEHVNNVLRVKIVDDHSSAIHDRCHERSVHIQADHVDMCRFIGLNDPEFRKVSSAMLRAQNQLPNSVLLSHSDGRQTDDRKPLGSSSENLSSEQIDMILAKLSFEGIDARYMALKSAQRQTCQWLPEHHSFKSRTNPSEMDVHHGFLWIKGKPGTGKSMSMKYLCQNAVQTKRGRIVIKFFFNARGAEHTHSTEGMYRSLLSQLIWVLRDTGVSSDILTQFLNLRDTKSWPIEALKEAFSSILVQINHRELYCFVDALDECPEDEIRDMISFFEELGERSILCSSNLRVCVSSRHYPYITIRHGLQLVLEDEDAHSNDIRHYIQSKLQIDHNLLRQKIEDDIFEKSSKIFLWAALVVDILNKENDKGGNISVQKRLQQIPRGLHDLFEDILTRDNENIEEMIRCIQWVLFARQPLRPEELYFALQLQNNNDASMGWDETSVPIDRINRFNLNVCKGLTEVTKKDATIHFIHESVRDYLLRENGLVRLLRFSKLQENFSESASHNNLRDICLTQVQVAKLTQESTQIEKLQRRMPFLKYAVTYVLHHSNAAQGSGSDQSSFLSNFPLKTWVKMNNGLQRLWSQRYSNRVNLLYLLAEQNLASLIYIHPDRHKSFTEFPRIERFPNPLVAAMAHGNDEAIFALALEGAKVLLSPDRLDWFEKEFRNVTCCGADLNGTYGKQMDAYSLVCSLSKTILVDILRNHVTALKDIKPEEMLRNFPDGMSLNMASHLTWGGPLVNAANGDGDTPRTRAVKADLLTAAERLLAQGADANSTPHHMGNCLSWAKSVLMVASLIKLGGNPGPSSGSLTSLTRDTEAIDLVHSLIETPNGDVRTTPYSDTKEGNLLYVIDRCHMHSRRFSA
ncbi:hypothetical protein F4803DRAFT_534198 [Xylaria telfairii]|nr:hypothetical protein F4803DRAFT_534198 [Xylaria telfairii]